MKNCVNKQKLHLTKRIMVRAFEPFSFQDHGKLPLVLRQLGHRLWTSMYRHQLIHKLPLVLIRDCDIGSVLKQNGYFSNRAGQQLYPLHMRPIIQCINIAGHFSVLNLFDREGIGKNRVFRLFMVKLPHFICMAAFQIDLPFPQGIGAAGPR